MNGTKLTEVMLDCWSITLLRDAYSIYSSRVEPPLHKESWGNRAGVVVLCSSVEIRLYLVLGTTIVLVVLYWSLTLVCPLSEKVFYVRVYESEWVKILFKVTFRIIGAWQGLVQILIYCFISTTCLLMTSKNWVYFYFTQTCTIEERSSNTTIRALTMMLKMIFDSWKKLGSLSKKIEINMDQVFVNT